MCSKRSKARRFTASSLASAWLFWLYDVINNLAPTRQALARLDAVNLLAFERSLHIDVELTLDRWLGAHSVVGFIGTYFYFFAHVLVTLTVLVCLWWARPSRRRTARCRIRAARGRASSAARSTVVIPE